MFSQIQNSLLEGIHITLADPVIAKNAVGPVVFYIFQFHHAGKGISVQFFLKFLVLSIYHNIDSF